MRLLQNSHLFSCKVAAPRPALILGHGSLTCVDTKSWQPDLFLCIVAALLPALILSRGSLTCFDTRRRQLDLYWCRVVTNDALWHKDSEFGGIHQAGARPVLAARRLLPDGVFDRIMAALSG